MIGLLFFIAFLTTLLCFRRYLAGRQPVLHGSIIHKINGRLVRKVVWMDGKKEVDFHG